MKGSYVLWRLVALVDETGGPVDAAAVAFDLALPDGRTVTQALDRLERAGLAGGKAGQRRAYWPTHRGIEVDRLVASATAARGGTFAPLNTLGLDYSEIWAIQRRIGS